MMSAYPKCPRCGTTGERCLRPSGHQAMYWHPEREDIVARQCRCKEICQPWLRKRAKKERSA